MSKTYIPIALRRQIIAKAQRVCEYCLIHQDDTFFGCHVDHIVSEKHGGLTVADNLALACTFCNLYKGSDLGSLVESGDLIRFYHPRTDVWSEHFVLTEATIEPLTEVGEVTVRIFRFNHSDRLLERQNLIDTGLYPRFDEE